jgi:hypothetical protein
MRRHRIRSLSAIIGVALATTLSLPASPLRASDEVPDQVLVWNLHAYNELVVGQGPASIQHLAMVHGAVYDAVNAIDGRYQPYLVAPPAQCTYSKDAAAATAAYEVLLFLLPSREPQLTGYYNDSLALIPDGTDE